MTVLELTPLLILRLGGDPALYVQAPFLGPMKKPALSLAARFKNVCTTCMKNARDKAADQMAGAFASLVLAESAQTPNRLPALKEAINRLLGTQHVEIMLRYRKDGRGEELLF